MDSPFQTVIQAQVVRPLVPHPLVLLLALLHLLSRHLLGKVCRSKQQSLQVMILEIF